MVMLPLVAAWMPSRWPVTVLPARGAIRAPAVPMLIVPLPVVALMPSAAPPEMLPVAPMVIAPAPVVLARMPVASPLTAPAPALMVIAEPPVEAAEMPTEPAPTPVTAPVVRWIAPEPVVEALTPVPLLAVT